MKKESIRFLLVARLIAEKVGIYLYVEAARQLKPLYPTVEFCLLGPLDASSSSAITNINEGVERRRLDKLSWFY